MEAYEFQAQVTPVGEPPGMYEERAWSRLTAEQFLAGYSDADAIYDLCTNGIISEN